MATGETGFDDTTFDLSSVQCHSPTAGHYCGRCLRDANNARSDAVALTDGPAEYENRDSRNGLRLTSNC